MHNIGSLAVKGDLEKRAHGLFASHGTRDEQGVCPLSCNQQIADRGDRDEAQDIAKNNTMTMKNGEPAMTMGGAPAMTMSGALALQSAVIIKRKSKVSQNPRNVRTEDRVPDFGGAGRTLPGEDRVTLDETVFWSGTALSFDISEELLDVEDNWQASDIESYLGNNSPGNEKPKRVRILPQYLAVICPRRRPISFAAADLSDGTMAGLA